MIEHDFANAVINNKQPNSLPSHIPTRDSVFDVALGYFDKGPVKIFQIGGIETFDLNWRVGSGWADMLFGDYIKEHGGELTVVDISLNNLAHSFYAAKNLEYDLNAVYGDAIDHIGPGYDVYYLDGSNDPQETLDQYLKIENESAVVLVDDFNIKGTLLKSYLLETETYYSHYNVANEVIVINNLERN